MLKRSVVLISQRNKISTLSFCLCRRRHRCCCCYYYHYYSRMTFEKRKITVNIFFFVFRELWFSYEVDYSYTCGSTAEKPFWISASECCASTLDCPPFRSIFLLFSLTLRDSQLFLHFFLFFLNCCFPFKFNHKSKLLHSSF